MTGTGTLNIHIKDQNDKLPELEMATMDMCLSDEPSKVNITAYDLDGEPYSGPFYFQPQVDDVKGKWRIDSDNGEVFLLIMPRTLRKNAFHTCSSGVPIGELFLDSDRTLLGSM